MLRRETKRKKRNGSETDYCDEKKKNMDKLSFTHTHTHTRTTQSNNRRQTTKITKIISSIRAQHSTRGRCDGQYNLFFTLTKGSVPLRTNTFNYVIYYMGTAMKTRLSHLISFFHPFLSLWFSRPFVMEIASSFSIFNVRLNRIGLIHPKFTNWFHLSSRENYLAYDCDSFEENRKEKERKLTQTQFEIVNCMRNEKCEISCSPSVENAFYCLNSKSV